MTALEVALDGRWADWHGLDPDLAPAELPDGLRARSSAGRVVLIEVDRPVAPGGVQSVLDTLGPPELAQPARFTRYGYETTDHVYPRRGLVLITAQAYAHGPPDRTVQLIRAELFVPTSLDEWHQHWRDLGRLRPDPH